LIEAVLEKATRSKQRVLLGFDFAYVYPVDFGPALQTATGSSDRDLPWTSVWQYLSEHLKDDEGTRPGAKPSNRSNRFEVADRINVFFRLTSRRPGRFGVFQKAQAANTSLKSDRQSRSRLRRATW